MSDMFDEMAVSPMLIAVEQPAFDSPDYLYELKLDGERGISYLGDNTALRNKRQLNMLLKFPELADLHKQVKKRCILDGEYIVTIDGKPNFAEVQRRSLMSNKFKINLAASKLPVSFVAYDILYRDGVELIDLPLEERKQILADTVVEGGGIAVSRVVERNGIALFELTVQQGLEGIVAKKKSSVYRPGKRTKDWIKCKNLLDDDYIIVGYIIKSAVVTSLVIAQYDGDTLVYCGHVTLGVSRSDFSIIAATPRSFKPFERNDDYDVTWIEPRNVCKVAFMERHPSGTLRQPVYKGLRLDKAAGDCVVKT